jgi:hypothetical protein
MRPNGNMSLNVRDIQEQFVREPAIASDEQLQNDG